jgi:hypothetical protein
MIPAWKPELLWPKTMLLFERQAMSVAERAFSSAGVAIRQRIRARQCEIIVLPHLKVDIFRAHCIARWKMHESRCKVGISLV